MKKVKRVVFLLLILIIVMQAMMLTAFAAGEPWVTKIGKFTAINRNNYHNYTGYVCAAQRYFLCDPVTSDLIADSGGVDGIFGDGLYNATVAFQALHDLDPDGYIGKNTWQAIAGELGVTTVYTQTTLSKGGQHVYLVDTSSSQYKFRYFTSQTYAGSVFHQG